ncbi:hypothetical protein EI94DRAFT_1809357 [Lactarius quietus]|nr:hypothetical protein EI94DRAFT_1809357 [Lactarius quietus]
MPKRKQSQNAHIQNLQNNKSRKVQGQEMNSVPEHGHNQNGNGSEHEHFHLNLQSTQKDPKEAGKCARTLHYPGNSERTKRRRRKDLKDLKAKGFQTLPDFFRNKAKEERKQVEFDTMGRDEEEEESSGADTKTQSTKIVAKQNTPSEPEVSEVMASLDTFEESEEETVAKMLEDLRCGNVPNDGSPLPPVDGVLALLRDRVALQMAQEEFAGVAKENKLGDFVLARVQAMAAFLNLFLDEDLEYTWKIASIITAKAQGQGNSQ